MIVLVCSECEHKYSECVCVPKGRTMDKDDELTVLRIIADALNNGDYDADPQQWKELAKVARDRQVHKENE